jgi:hypothetical protein
MISGLRLKIKPFGKWKRAELFTATLGPKITMAVMLAQRSHMRKLAQKVKDHIINQDLPWDPLAASTIARKGHDEVYVDQGIYLDNIGVWSSGLTWYAGIKRGVYYPDGSEVAAVAHMLENGNGFKLPARPVWGPSVKELGGYVGIRAAVITSLLITLKATNLSDFKITTLRQIFR